MVRYCEEEVELEEQILFRAEIDVEPDYLNTSFYLECALYFSDLSSIGGVDKWQETSAKANFKQVQCQTISLKTLGQSVLQYSPVTFKDHYYSTLGLTVQSVIIDYRFRQTPLVISESNQVG